MRYRLLFVLLALGLCAGLAAPARGSQLIARNAKNVHLAVNSQGAALVTYTDRGRVLHMLARGAVNARLRPPHPGVAQVKFRLDYTGGRASLGRGVWRHFRNGCRPYDGPPLDWFVAGCTAPDGSYWALQNWQKKWWLHLSHWTGAPARLDVYQDWVYSRHWEEVFGQFTYRGVGVRGFGTTHFGAPTDNFGRLLYLDTHNSRYGA